MKLTELQLAYKLAKEYLEYNAERSCSMEYEQEYDAVTILQENLKKEIMMIQAKASYEKHHSK